MTNFHGQSGLWNYCKITRDCLIMSCFLVRFTGPPRDGGKERSMYEKRETNTKV